MSLTPIDGGGESPPQIPMVSEVTEVVLGQAVPPGGSEPVVVLKVTTETTLPFTGDMAGEMQRLLGMGKLSIATEMPNTPPPGA